jgi:hypothetical protein
MTRNSHKAKGLAQEEAIVRKVEIQKQEWDRERPGALLARRTVEGMDLMIFCATQRAVADSPPWTMGNPQATTSQFGEGMDRILGLDPPQQSKAVIDLFAHKK